MEGTTSRAHTTADARGTACYRAPELVKEHRTFNNKVDIFGLGCILYELVTGGTKAFEDDFSVREYMVSQSEKDLPGSWEAELQDLVRRMVAIWPGRRPSASELRTQFAQNRAISVGNKFREKNEHSKSIEAYRMAIKLGSTDPSLWILLGDAFRAMNQFRSAKNAYSQTDEDNASQIVLTAMGECFYRCKDFGDALRVLEKAIKKKESDYYLPYKLLIETYIAVGDTNRAVKLHKSTLKKFPNVHSDMLHLHPAVTPKKVSAGDSAGGWYSRLSQRFDKPGPKLNVSTPVDPVHITHVRFDYHTGEFIACS